MVKALVTGGTNVNFKNFVFETSKSKLFRQSLIFFQFKSLLEDFSFKNSVDEMLEIART